MKLRLVRPSSRYKKSYIAALRESLGDSASPTYLQDQITNFAEFLTWWREVAGPRRRTTAITYWLVDGTKYYGFVQIRLQPGGRSPRIKSNIYYELRPSCRGHGLGSVLFKQAIRKAYSLGLKRVLVSCDEGNVASLRVIKDAKGKLVKTVRLRNEKTTMRLYEFKTAAGPAA
ncbi:MAG: GNAT family N-acetyltransferase [Proteobacteria bacterium]|nr:GNAT family N-acetyltransferase [Pseudomonadota bacterium]